MTNNPEFEEMTATREALEDAKKTYSALDQTIWRTYVEEGHRLYDAALAEVERWEQERAQLMQEREEYDRDLGRKMEARDNWHTAYVRERAAREAAERERDEVQAMLDATLAQPVYLERKEAEDENQRLREIIRAHWSPSQAEAILARREVRDE